jgi:hypothetical protein
MVELTNKITYNITNQMIFNFSRKNYFIPLKYQILKFCLEGKKISNKLLIWKIIRKNYTHSKNKGELLGFSKRYVQLDW